MTLLLMGVRDFKQVNDTLGRGSGDRLLKALSGRIAEFALKKQASAYRLAGDEFAVLMPSSMSESEIYDDAIDLQKQIGEPIELAGLTLIVKVRVGASRLPAHGKDGHELLRAADVALSWAAADASGICLYDPARDNSGPRTLEMISELRLALETDQLSLHLQPKISIKDRRLIGCEALMRWIHPRFGFVPPTTFIAIAETSELMSRMTLWVAKRALEHARELRDEGLDISIAINVSGHNMVDTDFPSQLNALLMQSGLSADAITLEITETVLMSDPDRAAMVIAELSGMGFALDIDDFGTGYSSLAYLRRLPLKSLKIDRAFVMELTANAQDAHIVQSIVGLAHGLNLNVIAEGVEDEPTMALLDELGTDTAQGYAISKPLPVPDFLLWAKRWGS